MPAYSFEALDAQGRSTKGVLEADTARAARTTLRGQGLIPVSVDAVSDSAGHTGSLNRGRRAFNGTQLAIWTRQLAGLTASGLPLERALTALADESESEAQRQLVAALRSEVNAGASLAKALGQHPREFNPVFVSVVSSGEQSGALAMVLERLADDLENMQNLRAKLIGAALYPAIVSVIALCIVIFLVSTVVPQVAGVFAGTKKALPLLTTVMLGVSSFVRSWGWLCALALVMGGLGFRYALKNDAFAKRFDAWWLTLPLVGRLSRSYNAARFSATLSMLSAAGVPILKGLQSAAETLSNKAMRQDALDAVGLVREGAPMASALDANKRFPSMLIMFARLGEQTGQLPVMLQRAAKQLGEEVQRRAMRVATILEPLLIVGMGAVVMLIVLAVLLPIIQLNTFIK
jgi:general secretion pathway protein F